MKLTDKQKLKMDEYGIPERMHGAIIRYYERGIPPGDFLSAVIDNDLFRAVAYGDSENIHTLRSYVLWFFNQAPGGTAGFKGATKKWCDEVAVEALKDVEPT